MKKILITCDTEVGELHSDRADAFEIFIKGQVGNKEVGVGLINSIASEFKVIVDHFVDIYPYEKYGEQKFKKLCEDIIKNGHKINLHTHPSGKFDKNRRFMYQYSLGEQIQIIKFGKEKLKEWLGIEVISHRAGGYGANDNTIKALVENDIFIDSSFFYKNPNCKISYDFVNRTFEKNGVLEIPVSVYKKTGFKTAIQKFDFRYGSNVKEILNAIDLMPQNSVIVIFLHSFNFLNLIYDFKNRKYKKISVNNRLIDEYRKLLSAISVKNDCKFTSIENLDKNNFYNDYIVDIWSRVNMAKKIKDKIALNFFNIGNV
ncbi:hypothetical protein [Campylobacter mucosalis]|uniref:hypothetical protein n=1 Tax=Campylobacter mucosalis TaxID=202 RepID=UPI00146FF815|nr:hypothetical protein [Campylobacter mucosalis]